MKNKLKIISIIILISSCKNKDFSKGNVLILNQNEIKKIYELEGKKNNDYIKNVIGYWVNDDKKINDVFMLKIQSNYKLYTCRSVGSVENKNISKFTYDNGQRQGFNFKLIGSNVLTFFKETDVTIDYVYYLFGKYEEKSDSIISAFFHKKMIRASIDDIKYFDEKCPN